MSDYAFTEQGPHEAGFARIFHDRIVPILKRHEETRKELKKKAMMGMGGAGVFGVGTGGAGYAAESVWGFVGGGIGAIGAFGVKAFFEGQWRAGLGGEVLPILCEHLGEMQYGQQQINLGDFTRLGVIPSYDTSSLEDPVNGEHDGLSWAMTEAHLKSKSRDSKGNTKTRTVFRGLLFRIQIFGPAPRIFFGKDRGGALNWLSEKMSSSRRGLEKIEIPNPDFEAVYETYTDNPMAAQSYIDERLTNGLMEIAEAEASKKYIACAMQGDGLYLALPRSGDFLGLGSLFKPLTDTVEKDLHEALQDLSLPARVIDRLRGV